MPSAKPKEATAHLDLAARDSKIKKLREKFLTVDHRLHLAQQAQAGEVLSKLLLKQVGEDATYPLRNMMLSGTTEDVAAVFEQLNVAKNDLTENQLVELINGRKNGDKDQVHTSLALAVALEGSENLDKISAMANGLKAIDASESTVVNVFNADNFGVNFSPMMVAVQRGNPPAIIKCGEALRQLKDSGQLTDAGLVAIFSKSDACGATALDSAMVSGPSGADGVHAVFAALVQVGMSGASVQQILGQSEGIVGATPMKKNTVQGGPPALIAAYADGLVMLKDAGMLSQDSLQGQFDTVAQNAAVIGNAAAVKELGDAMRRSNLPTDFVFNQLNPTVGTTLLQFLMERSAGKDLEVAQTVCDQLIQTDAARAQAAFESIPKFGLADEAMKTVLGNAIHAARAAQY
jgi:hypothetical protein